MSQAQDGEEFIGDIKMTIISGQKASDENWKRRSDLLALWLLEQWQRSQAKRCA